MGLSEIQKIGNKLFYQQYAYNVSKRSSNATYYACEKKCSKRCQARLILRQGKVTLTRHHSHNPQKDNHSHDPLTDTKEAKPTNQPSNVLKVSNEKGLCPNDSDLDAYSTSFRSFNKMDVSSNIFKSSENSYQQDSPSISGGSYTGLNPLQKFASLNGEDHTKAFIFTDGSDENEIIIFGVKDHLIYLSESAEWIIDGDFESRVSSCSELVIFHGFLKYGYAPPLIYCLLPNKLRETFQRMFSFLNKIARRRYCLLLRPTKIHLFYNPDLMHVAFQEFPQAEIKGLYFHFILQVFSMVNQLGLAQVQRNHPQLRIWFRRLFLLGFLLNRDNLVSIWMDLTSQNIPLLEPQALYIRPQKRLLPMYDFMGYFSNTWINGAYSETLWFQTSADFISTLACRENHSRINALLVNHKDNIENYIDALRHEEQKVRQEIAVGGRGFVMKCFDGESNNSCDLKTQFLREKVHLNQWRDIQEQIRIIQSHKGSDQKLLDYLDEFNFLHSYLM